MYRRLMTAVTIVGFALTPTACAAGSTVNPGPTATTASSVAPRDVEVLTHSIDALATTPYRFESTQSIGVSNSVTDTDRTKRLTRQTSTDPAKGTLTAETRLIVDDAYLNLGGSTFTHVDVTRLKPDSLTRTVPYTFADLVMPGVTEARLTGSRAYEGTIDLTIAIEKAAIPALKKLGETTLPVRKSPLIPFKATVDDQGRLLTFEYTQDLGLASGPFTITSTFSRYGQPVSVERPAANLITEATEQMYAIL